MPLAKDRFAYILQPWGVRDTSTYGLIGLEPFFIIVRAGPRFARPVPVVTLNVHAGLFPEGRQFARHNGSEGKRRRISINPKGAWRPRRTNAPGSRRKEGCSTRTCAPGRHGAVPAEARKAGLQVYIDDDETPRGFWLRNRRRETTRRTPRLGAKVTLGMAELGPSCPSLSPTLPQGLEIRVSPEIFVPRAFHTKHDPTVGDSHDQSAIPTSGGRRPGQMARSPALTGGTTPA
jgi:hypothetical protein